jgi:hypothetical protein
MVWKSLFLVIGSIISILQATGSPIALGDIQRTTPMYTASAVEEYVLANSGISSNAVQDLIAQGNFVSSNEVGNIVTNAELGLVQYIKDSNGKLTAIGIGPRMAGTKVGPYSLSIGGALSASGGRSLVQGWNSEARGNRAVAMGKDAIADGDISKAMGEYCKVGTSGTRSFVSGVHAYASRADAFVWSGVPYINEAEGQAGTNAYLDNGVGTFNINPQRGINGFYIGTNSLADIVNHIVYTNINGSIKNEIAEKRDLTNNVAASSSMYISKWEFYCDDPVIQDIIRTTPPEVLWDSTNNAWVVDFTTLSLPSNYTGYRVYGEGTLESTEVELGGAIVKHTNFGMWLQVTIRRSIEEVVQAGEFYVSRSYVTNQVTKLASALPSKEDIPERLSQLTNDVGYVTSSQLESSSYPMFIIDLNPDGENKWFHIELKATTNNFSTTGLSGMTFFCATSINGDHTLYQGAYPDWCKIYVLDSNADSDVRKWTAISNTTELATNDKSTGSLVIIVDPELLQREQGTNWLYEGNDELIWSYVRIGHSEPEKTSDNRQRWRAIMPVRWYKKLPSWANQGVSP